MKLELKENMYVRTNDGYIAKYDKSKHNCSGKYYGFASTIRDMRWEEYDDDCFLWESELKNIVKASYNIIDILEVGDVIEIDVIDEDNYPTIMGINFARIDNKVELASIKDMLKNESAKLLTVITHEQIEQMAYKVGE